MLRKRQKNGKDVRKRGKRFWCSFGGGRISMCNVLITFLLTLTLFGCAVGPNYQRPSVDVPQAWRFEDKEAKEVANTAWWEQFNDSVLNELIEIALKENKDVKIAAARIEQFVGQLQTTRSSLFPQISAGGSGGRQRDSELTGAIPLEGFSSAHPTYNNYEVFLKASWEIDLWGKVRRATEAARANILSTEEARRSVILTLVASVATSYVNLRDLDKELELTRRTAKSYKESYELFNFRYEHGAVSELEVSQAKSQYEQAMANIPYFQKLISQQENSLSVLLGRNPGPIARGKSIDELTLPVVPAGLPSELLTNRPDIRRAEQDLVAANADIGAAKAQYYPSISLTTLFGYASSDLSRLFNGPAMMSSLAGSLLAPIFTGGAISGKVKSAEAVQQQNLIRYRQVIQTAFQEVDDALVDQQRTREQLTSLLQQVEALQNYVRVARLQYDNGYTGYLEVLYAESLLYNAQLRLTEVQGTLFNALVSLYKSMGGGWVSEADRLTETTTD
jgi:multidrug efflux system outer membrane protein